MSDVPVLLQRGDIEYMLISQIAKHHNIKVLDFCSIWIEGGKKMTYENYLNWYLQTYTPLGKALK